MVSNVPVRSDNDPFLPVFCNDPFYNLVSLFSKLRINDRHSPADRSALIALTALIAVKYNGYIMRFNQFILYHEVNKVFARFIHIAVNRTYDIISVNYNAGNVRPLNLSALL